MDYTKTCKKCQQNKPLTDFSIFKQRNKLYYRYRCKICASQGTKELQKTYKQTTKEPISEKTCPRCKQTLPIINFKPNQWTKTGYRSWCISCEQIKNKEKAENIKNLPKIQVNGKRCCACKQYKTKALFHISNLYPDGLNLSCRECVKKAYFRHRKRAFQRRKEKLHTNPSFRLTENLRSRVRHAVKTQSKSASSLGLLGCTGKECMDYLERLFWPGMTRENMNKTGWVIDHIIPIASFNQTDPNWQFKAFHYTNTQPLWYIDNQQKGDRLDWTPQESKFELPERLKTHLKSPSL